MVLFSFGGHRFRICYFSISQVLNLWWLNILANTCKCYAGSGRSDDRSHPFGTPSKTTATSTWEYQGLPSSFKNEVGLKKSDFFVMVMHGKPSSTAITPSWLQQHSSSSTSNLTWSLIVVIKYLLRSGGVERSHDLQCIRWVLSVDRPLPGFSLWWCNTKLIGIPSFYHGIIWLPMIYTMQYSCHCQN